MFIYTPRAKTGLGESDTSRMGGGETNREALQIALWIGFQRVGGNVDKALRWSGINRMAIPLPPFPLLPSPPSQQAHAFVSGEPLGGGVCLASFSDCARRKAESCPFEPSSSKDDFMGSFFGSEAGRWDSRKCWSPPLPLSPHLSWDAQISTGEPQILGDLS